MLPALAIRGLGKAYRRAAGSSTTLGESVARWFSRGPVPPDADLFWALRDVSACVNRGEIVGIIGRNGAGKSTLLKIVAGVTSPTTGSIDVRGRVGSLLEVGTGFHPELTGRENIFLYGSFLGMRRTEIRERFDEIVEFAGVSEFLDLPVKRYSSGMAVRLAFAVAAHLDADILLIDEVLAVGDQAFQDKCLGKMRDVRQREGRTVLFVSHNLSSVVSLCTRALLIADGRVIADGPAADVAATYSAGVRRVEPNGSPTNLRDRSRARASAAHCTSVAVSAEDAGGAPSVLIPGATLVVSVTFDAHAAVRRALLGVLLNDERGRPALGVSTDTADVWIDADAGETRRVTVRLHDVRLKPGTYTLDLYLTTITEVLDDLDAAARIEVLSVPGAGYERWPDWPPAPYAPRFDALAE